MQKIKIVQWDRFIEISSEILSWKYSENEINKIFENALDKLDKKHQNEINNLRNENNKLFIDKIEEREKYENIIRLKDDEIKILKYENRKKCILF
jgi:hypothetical protein